MELLVIETGPGGTELMVRPAPSARPGKPGAVAAPSPTPVAESTASLLREAVEAARRENLPGGLDSAIRLRQRFWMDTCRETHEMQTASRQVLELHRQHGCRFGVPSPQQVQYLLDALDTALAGWDRNHPDLFYRTLELNFPELLRVCRAPRRA